MRQTFKNKVSKDDIHNTLLKSFGAKISQDDMDRLSRNRINWNFYEGFHWEAIGDTDKPQITVNFVRAFVDKFVSFELSRGFSVKMKPEIEGIDGDNDPLDFINGVWEYNDKLERCLELGQSKSLTGNGWIQVSFEHAYNEDGTPNEDFDDPFGEFEKGKIIITVLPDSIVFPIYDDAHDKDSVKELHIMYPISRKKDAFFGSKQETILYKQVWTKSRVEVFEGEELIYDIPNKYGVIPIRQIRNVPAQGKNTGMSDVDDIIPLNTEINLKNSDISEIIDYHSAPVTVVYGARIGQLERGANKVWGGLPKDAKIENLKLEGDLTAAQNYVDKLKKALHEVGNMPEGVLGGDLAISNTSGVALQISLMPLLERVKVKQVMTKEGIEYVNKLILLIGLEEGLIEMPTTVKMPADEAGVEVEYPIKRPNFFYNEVTFESVLPKDTLLELQEIELEMKLGLESREEGMKRRGKDNIQERIKAIDEDMEKNPKLYGKEDMEEQIELMKEQSKITKSDTPEPSDKERPVGVNKEGKSKEVNAGFQNSPEPKIKK